MQEKLEYKFNIHCGYHESGVYYFVTHPFNYNSSRTELIDLRQYIKFDVDHISNIFISSEMNSNSKYIPFHFESYTKEVDINWPHNLSYDQNILVIEYYSLSESRNKKINNILL